MRCVSPIFRPFSCEEALGKFEEHERPRLRNVEVRRRVDVDADEHETRIVVQEVARVALLAEPDLPVLGKELPDLRSVTREGRQA